MRKTSTQKTQRHASAGHRREGVYYKTKLQVEGQIDLNFRVKRSWSPGHYLPFPTCACTGSFKDVNYENMVLRCSTRAFGLPLGLLPEDRYWCEPQHGRICKHLPGQITIHHSLTMEQPLHHCANHRLTVQVFT